MWSGDEATYRNAFLKTLDYYISLNDSTAGEPYPYQSKWNCDGSFWIYEYQKNRTPQQFTKLIDQIRSGKITVPLSTLATVHGIAPLEVTLRDMYYAGSLERKYDLDLDLVIRRIRFYRLDYHPYGPAPGQNTHGGAYAPVLQKLPVCNHGLMRFTGIRASMIRRF